MTIKKITARYIYDSRGNPTVEVDLITGTFPAHSSDDGGAKFLM